MVYRVDYLAGVIALGVLVGWLVGRRGGLTPAAAARAVVVLVAVAVAGRALSLVGYALGGFSQAPRLLWGVVRDLHSLVFGVVVGLALSRALRGRAFLRRPDVLAALCLQTGSFFAFGAVASAMHYQGMLAFFTQSGYGETFLRLIMAVEVIGGVALLVPGSVPLGLVMLGVDMFGAIYTHAHNGDSVHDDMDAVAVLVRLALITVLWLLGRRPLALGRALVLAAAAAVVCTVIAVAGGSAARHLSHPPPPAQQPG